MGRVKGGKKRLSTTLEIRRKLWDALPLKARQGTKRPGSTNQRKQA